MKPLVEVMILHHNNRNLIKMCLDSVIQTKYSNLKIIVIDQNSKDDSVEFIEKNYPAVQIVKNTWNKPHSLAYNQVLKKSKADYCVLLNNDVVVDRNWIEELVKVADKDDSIFSLQPKFLDLKNKKMLEYAGAAGGFIDVYGFPVCRGRIFEKIEQDLGQYSNKKTFWSCGAALFLRRKILEDIGYLDNVIQVYAEELDLCWRANLAGYHNEFVASSVIYHLGSGTWKNKKLKLKKEYMHNRNHLILIFKNYSLHTLIKILPMRIFLDVIAFSRFLVNNPHKSMGIFMANLWLLGNVTKIRKMRRSIKGIKRISDKELKKSMISTSVALNHFISGKSNFKDFIKYIENY